MRGSPRLGALLAVLLVAPVGASGFPAAFELLAGSCWRGESGERTVDTHCYSWTMDGAFLRDRHEVVGWGEPYRGETIYRVDEEGAVRYVYFATGGGWSEGTAYEDGDTLRFPDEVWVDEDGSERRFRTVWSAIGPESYTSETQEFVDGDWVPAWSSEFQRVDGPAR